MLLPRLARRFALVTVLTFLALVMVNTTVVFPMWIYLLTLPIAALLTVLYWQTFRDTQVCPTCKGTGKIAVLQGGEVETDVCYSCDGEGRVPR